MGKDILKEALADAKQLEKAAIEHAKNVLAEAISPKVKGMIREAMNEVGEAPEDEKEVDLDSVGETDEVEEAKDINLDEPVEEAVACPEEEEDEKPVEEAQTFGGEETPEEELEAEAAAPEKDEKDEMYEISNLELESAIASLKTEAVAMGKLGEVQESEKNKDKAKKDVNWDEQTPPDMQDWTVKEQKLFKLYSRAMKENKILKAKLAEQNKLAQKLSESVHSTGLMNTKLNYLLKLTSKYPKLTKNNKFFIVEKLDKADTIKEARLVYDAIQSVLEEQNKQKLNENRRQPASEVFTGRKPASALNESADTDRAKRLAGIIND